MGWVWKERDSWRGAYRDESDKRHTKSFRRQIDATLWIATEEAKIVRGDWVDPTGEGHLRRLLQRVGTSTSLGVLDPGERGSGYRPV